MATFSQYPQSYHSIQQHQFGNSSLAHQQATRQPQQLERVHPSRGQEAAWLQGSSHAVHGRPHIHLHPSPPHPTYNTSYEDEHLPLSSHNFFDQSQYILGAPQAGAPYPSPSPSPIYARATLAAAPVPVAQYPSPTPSPTFPEVEPMDLNGNFYFATVPEPIQALPPYQPPSPGANGHKMKCQWQHCDIVLDDLTCSGIRRHFREHHPAPRGTSVRCEWGRNCRSEEMLNENIPKHIAECHLKTMRVTCASCGNGFARQDTLKRHLTAGCPALARGQS